METKDQNRTEITGTTEIITVSPRLVKAGDQVEVVFVEQPRGRARFSIAGVFGATDAAMAEDSDRLGTYTGTYTARGGDNVEDASVTVVFTSQDGETVCCKGKQKVTIDTIAPRISEARISRDTVRNGQSFGLRVSAEPGCRVAADISSVDTTKPRTFLPEKRDTPGTYEKRIRISKRNLASNGMQTIPIIATDAAGNESATAVVEIELHNPELHLIRELGKDVASRLDREGIVTLADLRRMDTEEFAASTGLPTEELEYHRAAAKLQAVGLDPNISYTLSRLGGIHGPTELALLSHAEIAAIIEAGVGEGIISEEFVIPADLVALVQAAGTGAMTEYLSAYRKEAHQAVDTCQSGCSEDLSVFSCHAYLMELHRLTGMTWQGLRQRFKQDFLAVTTAPARRIDISIDVLERAIAEDLGNPPRLAHHWQEYDQALHEALKGILAGYMGKSENELPACFPLHPIAFDAQLPLAERNGELEQILRHLMLEPGYWQELVSRLAERTGKPLAELEQKYPDAFQPAMTFEARNKALHTILGLPTPAASVDAATADLAILRLDALVIQSGRSPAWLRQKYHISFVPAVCAETTTCRQAILTLQEYLAEKRLAYPTYDEWRLKQVKMFHPESIYVHEFKVSLIRGDRQLLRQHLEQARVILDNVRVSEGGKPPQEDDLLKTRWRIYYPNLKTGLDLIQECWEVDDLMVKGHQAFHNEEYQLAWQYYLEAAEKIRLTSGKISRGMQDALLPLWAPEGDCLFRRHPQELSKHALDYLQAILASYAQENIPGVGLIKGEIKLQGIDSDGTFKQMHNQALSNFGWEEISGKWQVKTGSEGELRPLSDDTLAVLLYKGGQNWTDIRIELETYTSNWMIGGVLFRLVPGLTNVRGGFVGVFADVGKPAYKGIGIIDPLWLSYNIPYHEHLLQGKPFTPVTAPQEFNPGFEEKNGSYQMAVEVTGQEIKAEFWRIRPDGKRDPDGNLSWSVKQLLERGTIALFAAKFPLDLFWNEFRRIRVFDLSPAKGALSDAAFFLAPEWRTFPNALGIIYFLRWLVPKDANKMIACLESLPQMISIPYEEDNWIVQVPDVAQDHFDSFDEPSGTGQHGLWYERGDARLERAHARNMLDGLPMVFCHQYFFLLPICLGDTASALGRFEEALQWYRMVYDERRPPGQRGNYAFLNHEIEGKMLGLRIAQNYVEWADFLFNQNTEESVNEARIRYSQALRTLETEGCCEQERNLVLYFHKLGQNLLAEPGPIDASLASQIYRGVAGPANKPGQHARIQGLLEKMQQVMLDDVVAAMRAPRLVELLADQASVITPQPRLSTILEREQTLPERLIDFERRYPAVLDNIEANIRLHEALTRQPPVEGISGAQPMPPLLSPPPEAPLTKPKAEPPVLPSGFGAMSTVQPVPFQAYMNNVLREKYEAVAPLLGWPTLVPEPPILSVRAELPVVFSVVPPWLRFDQCVPKNPVLDALTRRACLGIYHIDYCFNALGFPQNDLSIYRFEYLLSMARNFAQMALAAEKDFIQFKEQFERDALELMNASQVVAIGQAGVQLATFRVKEALDQIDVANLGIQRVNAQIVLTQTRIDELGSFWSIFGTVMGAIAAAVTAYFTAGASVAAYAGVTAAAIKVAVAAGTSAAIAGTTSYMAGIEDSKESLEMQLQLLKTAEYKAARQNLRNAIDAERSASQQARIAELEAQFAAEKAKLLAAEFFNPQLWSFLAQEVKKNYRTYLTYGATAAWLAQRALEFERGVEPRRRFAASGPDEAGSGLNIVRFDYFQPSLQGLLGADSLYRDIATLENEKLLHEQRKKQITKVVSLAATRPYLFAQFLQTGLLPFATTLEEFDWDYPGHYQRRIRQARVNLFGLVGQEGIKATLSCNGTSQVVVKEFVVKDGQSKPRFMEKTLRRLPENVALTSPQGGGIGQIPLIPKEEMLNPFEGLGVAAQWVFEMPKYANQIDYSTITDIQILIDYTALDDPLYRDEVLRRLPRRRSALRTFSFRLEFPDALFHLKDSPLPLNMVQTSDGTTGLYTLALDTRTGDFPPNQANRKLTDMALYIRSKGQDFRPLQIRLTTRSWLLDQDPNWREAELAPNDFTNIEVPPMNSPEPHYLGRQHVDQPGVTESVVDRWYCYISPDDNDAFLKKEGGIPVLINGHKVFDFSQIEDVIFGLNYAYDAPLPNLR